MLQCNQLIRVWDGKFHDIYYQMSLSWQWIPGTLKDLRVPRVEPGPHHGKAECFTIIILHTLHLCDFSPSLSKFGGYLSFFHWPERICDSRSLNVWRPRAGTGCLQWEYPSSRIGLGLKKLSVNWCLLRNQCLTHYPCSVLLLWKLKMADFCILIVVNTAVFVVHFSKVTTSAKRWTRIKRNQMCVFGMQYFCITNSYILTHINPMICEFCQLLLCLLNQIQ